ncbi:MAG TPA: pyridoxamine 5'-phosphate oxidase family protein [Actinoplanes sp.]|jgi:general stress protein 26|nr:pyridoxamine 5'-phosphate oxidase family protein [Actinoplanes sp.]
MSEPIVEFNSDYSEPGATAVPWADVDDVLTKSEMFWLSTVRGDGRPHVTPLPAIWFDRVLHFCCGDQEQKSANLRSNPNCVLTTGTNQMHSGLDVVVEGVAQRVTEHAKLVELARLWKTKLDWDFEVGEDAFKDPAGRNGLVYGVAPAKVLAFGKSPYTQTRYRFS